MDPARLPLPRRRIGRPRLSCAAGDGALPAFALGRVRALRLREIGRDRAQTLLTPFDRPERLTATRRPRVVGRGAGCTSSIARSSQLHPFGRFARPRSAPIRLLPYQLEPALAVLRYGVTRLLIADGVGLGQDDSGRAAAARARASPRACRALVLAPAGLRDQWMPSSPSRFGLTPLLADTAWLRSTSAERPAHVNPWSLPGIYVASHDFVKRPEVLRPLEDVTWDIVVIDEAHAATSGTDRRAAIARDRRTLAPRGAADRDAARGDPAELDALCRIGGQPTIRPSMLFERSRVGRRRRPPRKTMVLPVVPSGRRAADARPARSLQRADMAGSRQARRRPRAAGVDRPAQARAVERGRRSRPLSTAAGPADDRARRTSPGSWLCRSPERTRTRSKTTASGGARGAGLADPKRERRWLRPSPRPPGGRAATSARSRSCCGSSRASASRSIVFTEYRDTLARLEQRARRRRASAACSCTAA